MSGGNTLFEADPAAVVKSQTVPKALVNRTFRVFAPDRMLLLPPSLDAWLPEEHVARLVAELVDDVLDLTAIRADCTDKRGYPPYGPRLMVRLLRPP